MVLKLQRKEQKRPVFPMTPDQVPIKAVIINRAQMMLQLTTAVNKNLRFVQQHAASVEN